MFIREWVVSLKNRYQVRDFGGAGHQGRDVVARDECGRYFYYQCKHYDHKRLFHRMLDEGITNTKLMEQSRFSAIIIT